MRVSADVPSNRGKSRIEVDAGLQISFNKWMKKHGKVIPPTVTEEQRKEFQECFQLMDEAGFDELVLM